MRFTSVERNGGLTAGASGVFAKMLSKQLDNQVSLSDRIDSSDLLRIYTEQNEEEEVFSESEAEGEGSGEE